MDGCPGVETMSLTGPCGFKVAGKKRGAGSPPGTWPLVGYYGEQLDGLRADMAGQPLAEGWSGALVGMEADAKARKELHGFRRSGVPKPSPPLKDHTATSCNCPGGKSASAFASGASQKVSIRTLSQR